MEVEFAVLHCEAERFVQADGGYILFPYVQVDGG